MQNKSRKTVKIENPYKFDKQISKDHRKTVKALKYLETKEIKREVAALTSAVGYKGDTKHRAEEVIMLNSKSASSSKPLSKKERMEQQEELKRKVNKLFDMRASDPLIINTLKRTDTVLDKVKNINENYFASRGKFYIQLTLSYIDSIAKKKNN